jgi:serine/threonine protein kinase
MPAELDKGHQSNLNLPNLSRGRSPTWWSEQTGRMNRSIDSRSDLYSFGITLYEMLAGALPFTASDPMEWDHCHSARQLGVHSRYGLHTPLSPTRDTHSEGFSYFVTSIAAPAASGWRGPRVGLAPTGKRRLPRHALLGHRAVTSEMLDSTSEYQCGFTRLF